MMMLTAMQEDQGPLRKPGLKLLSSTMYQMLHRWERSPMEKLRDHLQHVSRLQGINLANRLQAYCRVMGSFTTSPQIPCWHRQV